MRSTLFAILVLLVLAMQTAANTIHASNTVVGNILAEPYVAIFATLLLLIAAMM
jgi:hypothetical protein